MKTYAVVLILMLSATAIYSQNIDTEVEGGEICDSLFWTSTEYPVHLKNDISEIQKKLSDHLTLYPEDLEKTVSLTYRFKITCAGINVGSGLESYKGPQSLGLSLRIKTILDEICTWSPAILYEKPVNSFYYLTVDVQKGRISIVPQNKNER